MTERIFLTIAKTARIAITIRTVIVYAFPFDVENFQRGQTAIKATPIQTAIMRRKRKIESSNEVNLFIKK